MGTANLPEDRFAKLLEEEIESARTERRVISRTMLAHLLHDNMGVGIRDAETIVDDYCDEKAPAVPTFLSNEFGLPYLKVIAIINVVLAMGCLGVAMRGGIPVAPMWVGVLFGTIFLIAAVLFWVKSINATQKPEPKKAVRHVQFTHDP